MPESSNKYVAVAARDRLWQGEVVANLKQVRQSLETVGGNGAPKLDEALHPIAVVLTQDCDLEKDYLVRAGDRKPTFRLPNVLFCEATLVQTLKGLMPSTEVWKRVTQNQDQRYQCIEAVPIECDAAGVGLGAIGIDFTRYFTVPTDEVYRRIEIGEIRRVCRLVTPYCEHLSHRFFSFRARIALPVDHEIGDAGTAGRLGPSPTAEKPGQG